jgi:hypothetical protein
MTADRADDVRRAGARRKRVSAGVLADRMAATLVHHEPGWRLPRLTAMARRFNVSAAEVDAAIDDLTARHLLRRLPDGQVYRASPAEYQVPLEGLSGLTSQVDPMGGQLLCKSRQVSRRRPPEDVGRSLELEAGEPVLVIRCVWTVGVSRVRCRPATCPSAWASCGQTSGRRRSPRRVITHRWTACRRQARTIVRPPEKAPRRPWRPGPGRWPRPRPR